MNSINIAERMWFEETLLGATLNYWSPQDPEAILFRVGISFNSLEECSRRLGGSSTFWTIRDGSLSIHGDSEQLTLTFSAADPQGIQTSVPLYGEELRLFKAAIHSFGARKQAFLN